MWVARIAGDPSSTLAWKTGAAGERRVAARLTKLLDGTGVQLLHDRRVSTRRKTNIDHIAIGPGGVTVIDAKAVRGRVRVELSGGLLYQGHRLLRVAGRDRTILVRGVQAQAEVVRQLLCETGFAAVEVRPALCFADAEGLPLFRRLELDGVMIDGPRRVAKLANRPGSLGKKDIQRIFSELASVLAPA